MTAIPLMSVLLLAGLPSDGPAWGEFRGPNGSGVQRNCAAPADPDPAAPTWAVAAPAGQSSPVLFGDAVVLTGVEDGRFLVRAHDRGDGTERWTYRGPDVPLESVHASGSAAASTPCTDGERLCVDFGSFGVLCLDADGEELWRRPLPVPKSLYGTSASPIVHGGRVFVARDDDATLPDSKLSRSRLLVLDAETGETIWEAPRPTHRSGWSTPTIWERPDGDDRGRTELVVLGNGRLRGYDAADGRELWSVGGFSRETIARPLVVRLDGGGTRAIGSAAMLGGVADDSPDPAPFWEAVIAFDADGDGRLRRSEMTGHFTFPFRPHLPPGHPGFGMPLPKDPAKRAASLDRMHAGVDADGDGAWTREEFLARLNFDRGGPQLVSVRPGGTGDVGDSHLDWTVRRGVAEIPTPLAFGGLLYQIADGGVLTVVSLAEGEVVDRRRIGAGGHYRASPVAAIGPDGAAHLFLLSQAGAMTVLKAGRVPEVVHRATFPGPVAATPALDAETLYVRTAGRLLAFRSSSPAPRTSR
ncbi:PQQ-binding-like beta-propeller repeat protein [Alienimonas chondri]|uniref:Pyrrolo-quinoline quinone repeat domain-containing protein n=1 Tax=Alienimonas chondri TaxID=2681879 RepID=A0ABX1VAX0_9PLAN|nr:PQQ-binding-like beta-propeller repeat protein [Alienimonas chondri]NNJ24889.1 hypothetical protein [Alienimonas chondri]